MCFIQFICIRTVMRALNALRRLCVLYYGDCFLVEWLESVGYRVEYELDYKITILYVVSIQRFLGKFHVVPVGDTGTIPHHVRNTFPGAPGDRRPGAGDGCRMWFINSWSLGWSRDL
jgi:hypothetical protein